MDRIPEDVRDRILSDETFQVIGEESSTVMGCFMRFDDPVSHLVFLHHELLVKPEYFILYIIAHEFAHWISLSGPVSLHEKEAEDLVIRWGFKEEAEKVGYYRAGLESRGFQMGYEWAKKQKRELLAEYEEFLDEWEIGNWSGERLLELGDAVDAISICESMGEEISTCPPEEISNKDILPRDAEFWYDRGIAFGVLSYVHELFRGARRNI